MAYAARPLKRCLHLALFNQQQQALTTTRWRQARVLECLAVLPLRRAARRIGDMSHLANELGGI
jgi:hypothetical protein